MAKRTNLNPIGGSGVKGAVGAGPARSDLNSYPSAASGAGGGSTTINNINQTTVIQGDTNPYGSAPEIPPNYLTLNYSGFVNPELVELTYNGITRKVTLSGDYNLYVLAREVYLPTSSVSAAHANEAGIWYLSYDPDSGLTWAKNTLWAFDHIPVCAVYYSADDKFGVRVAQGTNHWRSQKIMHDQVGAYVVSGGGLSALVLASYTAANRRPAVAECVVAVGETPTTNPALVAGTYTQVLFTGTAAAPVADFVPSAGDILPVTAGVAYYNAVSTSFSQVALAADEYGAVWLVAVPATLDAGSQAYRYLWVQGQTHSTSLVVATAWEFDDLNLVGLANVYAYVAVAKMLVRMNAAGTDWSVVATTVLEGSQNSGSVNADARYLAVVTHDTSLTGEGTVADPLVIKGTATSPLTGIGTVADPFAIPLATATITGAMSSTYADKLDQLVTTDTTLTGHGTTISPLCVGPHTQNVSTIGDATTVGQNLVKLPDPSAIRFLRINADNTVSALSDADMLAALGVTYTNVNPVPVAVGGVGVGETFSGETTNQVFDRLFYPALYPSFTNPSSSFSLTQSGYHEIGEVVATLNFSASFSRGKISPAYGTSGYRSGLPNQYNYTGTGLSPKASSSLSDAETVSSYTVLTGAQSWTESVSYNIGEQPLDSEGGNYSTPLAAGTSATQTQTITGVYPWYATSVAIATLTKQALTSMSSSYVQVTMIAEDGVDKQKAAFPDGWSAITGVQFYNTVSSAWEWIGGTKANSLTAWDITATTETIQGNVIDYDLYTHNGATIGSRQLRWYTT